MKPRGELRDNNQLSSIFFVEKMLVQSSAECRVSAYYYAVHFEFDRKIQSSQWKLCVYTCSYDVTLFL